MLYFTNDNDPRVGYIPQFLDERDPRPAKEQLHTAYAHGGGWHPFNGFKLYDAGRPGYAYLTYPGDPPVREVGRGKLRDEKIIIFEYSWVAVVQPDGNYEIARMD